MTENPIEPEPEDRLVQARRLTLRSRMLGDLAAHLPDEWLANSKSSDRAEFRKHLEASETMAEIVGIVSRTIMTIEEEERRARSPE